MVDIQEKVEVERTNSKIVESVLKERRQPYQDSTSLSEIESSSPQVVHYVGVNVKLGSNVCARAWAVVKTWTRKEDTSKVEVKAWAQYEGIR
jgi:hypothetical protein